MSWADVNGTKLEVIDTGIQCYVVVVTPEFAADMLEFHNDSNWRQKIRSAEVKRYGKDMLEGNWHLNGETIVLDRDGKLRNGQHRLSACVQFEVPFTTVLVVGVDPDSDKATDTGSTRNFRQWYSKQGGEHATDIAATVNAIVQLDNLLSGKAGGRISKMSIDEMDAVFQANPHIHEALEIGLKTKPVLSASLSTAFINHLMNISDPRQTPQIEQFFDSLTSGAGLGADSPILKFRNWKMKFGSQASIQDRAIILKNLSRAWNAQLKGRTSFRAQKAGQMPRSLVPADSMTRSSFTTTTYVQK